jgi:hypothetical protein
VHHSRKGNSAIGTAVVLLVLGVVFIYFVIPSAPAQTIHSSVVVGPAETLAQAVKGFPTVDDDSCEGISPVLSNTLDIIQDMSQSFGVSFSPVQVDLSQCDVVIQFVPILGSYNNFIVSAQEFNSNNLTSVQVFYENAFILSSNFIIINDAVSYKIAFETTGELNDALGLASVRSLCGNECYSVVLSAIHWTIRDYMNSFLCQFENWALTYVPTLTKAC